MAQDSTITGIDAWRAWRRLPKATRKELMKRSPVTHEEASVALSYARFALSGLGLVLLLGPAVMIFVGVSLAMAVLDIGPDTFDIVLFSALMVFIAFNHVSSSNRLRARNQYALHRDDFGSGQI